MPAEPGIRSIRNADFHFAVCRKDDPVEKQSVAARELLHHIGEVDCEAWTDGSVGKPILNANNLPSTRAAVKWDEGWFSGTICEGDGMKHSAEFRSFKAARRIEPDILIQYDDEFRMCYRLDRDNAISDEDGHVLQVRILDVGTVDGGGYLIWWKGSIEPQKGIVPAGIGVCSYTAELAAFRRALSEIAVKLCCGWRGTIRFAMDSKSLVQGLQMSQRRQRRQLQDTSECMTLITNYCQFQIVWLLGHCGLPQNEAADELARKSLGLPLAQQLRKEIDFLEVKQRTRVRLTSTELVSEVPETLSKVLTLRRAHTALSQIFTGHVPTLHPVSTFLNNRKCFCPLGCGLNILNSVDHFVLRCRRRAASRTRELPPLRERQGSDAESIVRTWPEKVSVYLEREGFFSM